jgi:serine/threonine protein kinase
MTDALVANAGRQELYLKAAETFELVCDLPPFRRDSELAKACGSDLELRREVLSLLSHHRSPTAAPTPAGRARRARTLQAILDALAAALVLIALAGMELLRRVGLFGRSSKPGHAGPYVLDRRIGSGGQSEVYLAHHGLLMRPAAVKVLRARGSKGPAFDRFEREAKIVSRLSHPNTVQVHDYGRTRDGRLYLAMEHIEGLDLSRLVALAGPLEPARTLHLLDQVCGSLEEAHASGLVHRDIKPANVMVCRRGGHYDVVKVLDFGIAHSAELAMRTGGRLDELAGTPLYMAPERFQSPGSADPRSDLYSLGVLAFYLLTGRDVFEGPEPEDYLHQILSVDPVPPSRLRREPLPPDLEKLVLDLLAKEPGRRPAGVAEVRRIIAAIQVPVRWTPDAARRWWMDSGPRS